MTVKLAFRWLHIETGKDLSDQDHPPQSSVKGPRPGPASSGSRTSGLENKGNRASSRSL
jgi:hypothetical protein